MEAISARRTARLIALNSRRSCLLTLLFVAVSGEVVLHHSSMSSISRLLVSRCCGLAGDACYSFSVALIALSMCLHLSSSCREVARSQALCLGLFGIVLCPLVAMCSLLPQL